MCEKFAFILCSRSLNLVSETSFVGWEQAEAEVTTLKGLLEASCQKNASLQDQVSHLDEALKECVRQLRLAKEEQGDKIREIVSKSLVPQSENPELQNHGRVHFPNSGCRFGHCCYFCFLV
jgi:hypothetical protein